MTERAGHRGMWRLRHRQNSRTVEPPFGALGLPPGQGFRSIHLWLWTVNYLPALMGVFRLTYDSQDCGPTEIRAHDYFWEGPETVFFDAHGRELMRLTRVQSIERLRVG